MRERIKRHEIFVGICLLHRLLVRPRMRWQASFCLVCFVVSFKLSFVYLLLVDRVYCCSCLMCVVISCVFVVLCGHCFFFYFRCRTAGYKSVFGRSCDRPSRHRFFLVSLYLKPNAEMIPKIPSCHYMLLMLPSRLKFSSNQFHVLFTCKITTATG